jgi:hypothetical protein
MKKVAYIIAVPAKTKKYTGSKYFWGVMNFTNFPNNRDIYELVTFRLNLREEDVEICHAEVVSSDEKVCSFIAFENRKNNPGVLSYVYNRNITPQCIKSSYIFSKEINAC